MRSPAPLLVLPARRARDLTGRFDGVIGAALSADGTTVLVQRGYFDDPRRQSVATIPFAGGRATVLVRHGSAPSWGGRARI